MLAEEEKNNTYVSAEAAEGGMHLSHLWASDRTIMHQQSQQACAPCETMYVSPLRPYALGVGSQQAARGLVVLSWAGSDHASDYAGVPLGQKRVLGGFVHVFEYPQHSESQLAVAPAAGPWPSSTSEAIFCRRSTVERHPARGGLPCLACALVA